MTWSIGNVWKDDEVGREDPKRKRLEREKERPLRKSQLHNSKVGQEKS